MQLLKKVLDQLNGYAYRQEYLCLAAGPFDSLYAYIVQHDTVVKDITHHHLFTGYCPLIFAFPHLDQPGLSTLQELEVRFSPRLLPPGSILKPRTAVAQLKLRKIQQQDHSIFFYEGVSGSHRFVSRFHQLVNGVNNRVHQQKAGNVYLDNRLYPQVQIGYALPRQISLISLQVGGAYNLFPTDLHGQISPAQYIVSLRHAGLACQQVQQAGKIVVSAVEPSLYKEVYRLGKNHMQPVKPAAEFGFSGQYSTLFGLPLPPKTVGYHELALRHSFDRGIHRVLVFEVKNQCNEPGGQPLRHIHSSYATWRLKHGLPGNYLLR